MQNINCWESKFQACQYSDELLSVIELLNKKVRIPADINIIKKACHVARLYHGDQTRKSLEPYYSHPLIMAYLFASYVGNNMQKYYTTNLIVIAILHDTIEDTKLTYEMIAEIFNRNVAEGVKDLTRLKHGIKIGAWESVILLVLERKDDILHVKVFDRLHNMQTICFMSPEKQITIPQETYDFIIPVARYLKLNKIEEELINLCSPHIDTSSYFLQHHEQNLFSFEDSFLILSPVFQNEVPQANNL